MERRPTRNSADAAPARPRTSATRCWLNRVGSPIGVLGDNDRADQLGARSERVEYPTARLTGRGLDPLQACRLAGDERHIEAMERMSQALTERLHECFLSSPAIEKGERLLDRIERQVGSVLARREGQRRNGVRIRQAPHPLDVDADLASVREGERRDILVMGNIEPQVAAEAWVEARLAAGAVNQLDGFGRYGEPLAQPLPQPRPGNREAPALPIPG